MGNLKINYGLIRFTTFGTQNLPGVSTFFFTKHYEISLILNFFNVSIHSIPLKSNQTMKRTLKILNLNVNKAVNSIILM